MNAPTAPTAPTTKEAKETKATKEAKETKATKEIEQVVLTARKDGFRAAKTFIWSAEKKDRNITFLKSELVIDFPLDLVEKYIAGGLINAPVKDED